MARVYTEKQTAAIETRDRTLLVSAAAGSGKTATLTERIIRSILDEDDPISISDMLIVTFTKAATGELRERIAAAIKAKLAEHPGDGRLEGQLHMLASAHISTIDSFCSDILRANCDRVGVNPAYRIADDAEAELLAESILDGMFSDIYSGELSDVATADELEELSDCLTDTRDQDALSVVVRMFYTSVADTELGVGTIRELVEEYNTEGFTSVEHCRFGEHTVNVAHEFAEHYRSLISEQLEAHVRAGDPKCARRINVLEGDLVFLNSVLEANTYEGLRTLLRDTVLPTTPQLRGREELSGLSGIRQAMKKAAVDIASSFFEHSSEAWVASYDALYRVLSVLVRILEKFDELFRREKLRLGICEYSDVARYTYECLWQNGERTDVALAEAAKWRAVYVDEYQDVNGVQHKIFEAISTPTNRFMVGDIKQSIYGFRSADPTIFAKMKGEFPELGATGDYPAASIFMSDNFRCDRGVIDFVNSIFDRLFEVLKESIGYVSADRLIYSKVYPDGEPKYRVPELCLLPYGGMDGVLGDDGEELDPAPMLVAEKINELLECGTLSSGKPIHPGDVAIILRNAKGKDKKYAAALEAMGIPTSLPDTTSFFLNSEILLILSILNTVDNPRRDVYLTATLMSPIFGFTADDLTAIASMGEPSLYDSLMAYADQNPDFKKGIDFLSWLEKFRVYSEGCAVDVLINRIYRDTGLLALASRDGGKEHLLRFYEHARQYESSSLRGLYNFLGYINSIIDRKNAFDKREAVTGGDTVKILTAHSSKGLEFPIVFFVGTDQSMKRSREEENRLVYDSKFGIAMYLRTPSGLSLVKNPTKSIVMDYKLRRKIEEEARLLYVILTRAREQLYLIGKSRSGYDGYKEKIVEAHEHLTPYTVYGMKNYTDMITFSTGTSFMTPEEFLPGMSDELRDAIYPPEKEDGDDVEEGFELPDAPSEELAFDRNNAGRDDFSSGSDGEGGTNALADELYRRFSFEYPDAHLSHLPEKLSVSRLYPEVLDPSRDEEMVLDDGESKVKYTKMGKLPRFATGSDETESAKRGIATHLFFQFCDLRALSENGARAELERLNAEKYISDEDAKRVRINEVEAFRSSSLFSDMLGAARLWRELRFNTRLPATMLATDEELLSRLKGEEILVQGVIDCLIEDSEGELHLVDYKTDRLTREERENPALAEARLRESHSLQLSYYSAAIERMFGKKPLTVEVYSLHLGRRVDVKIREEK